MTRPYRRLFIPDSHHPFSDKSAYSIALEIGKEFRPDEIVILGDFFDCYSISEYPKDPLKGYHILKDELDEASGELRRLEAFVKPKHRIIFIEGNHEFRIRRYIRKYADILSGLITTSDILRIPKHWLWVDWGPRNFYRCGKLIATHGSLSSKHVAAAMLSKYVASVIFGHTHRIQEFNQLTVHGERRKAVTIGWLGDAGRAAEYIENVVDYQHGVGLGYFWPDGNFQLDVIEIGPKGAIYGDRIING